MNTRKRFYLYLGIPSLLFLGLTACQKQGMMPANAASSLTKPDLTVGLPPPLIVWSPFPAIPYSYLGQPIFNVYQNVGFTVNNEGFVLGGTLNPQQVLVPDLWMWAAPAQTWTKMAPYPGDYANLYGEGVFVIGDNAYVIQGSSVWQYNQPANQWTAKKPFPGGARTYPTSMAINGKGYLGLGLLTSNNTAQKDWWQYDPTGDSWTRMQDYKGAARSDAAGFVVNGKGYVCLGYDNNSMYHTLWQYNPTGDAWTQKTSWPGSGWYYPSAVTATIGGVTFGLVTDGDSLWNYNPATDAWSNAGQVKYGPFIYPAVLVVSNRLIFENKSGAVYLWSN